MSSPQADRRMRRSRPHTAMLVVIAVGVLMVMGTAAGFVGDGARGATTGLKATCLTAGTATPKTLGGGPWLLHPGDRKSQTFVAEAEYGPLPADCEETFERTPSVRFQVQSPISH